MRVGLVCPYALDTPGGVQNHVRDLAGSLHLLGHHVTVLAPGESDDLTGHPDYVVPAGRPVSVPYNGSVARLTFGPAAMARTRRWLREHDLDVLHVHEPATPSVSVLALWAATGPVVATFHTAMERSRAMTASAGILRPAMDKISARIAVSEQARSRLRAAFGEDAVVIPNGVWVNRFAQFGPASAGDGDRRPTVLFLGRYEEPRKGLGVLLDAWPQIHAARPQSRLVVAGNGDESVVWNRVQPALRDAVRVATVDDTQRDRLLAGAAVYVAPHLRGESFGVVLVEAMAAGAPVVASDLPAFRDVLGGGRWGTLVPTGDPGRLAAAVVSDLDDPAARVRAEGARTAARVYDWSVVTQQILRVYETVVGTGGRRGGG
ncbi:MAG: glycosyltransferase family 4 protein [Nocardioidaceae bacterium]